MTLSIRDFWHIASSIPGGYLVLDRQLRHSQMAIPRAIAAFLEASSSDTLVTLLAESRQLQEVLDRFLLLAPRGVDLPTPADYPPVPG
jgi:hypothetical protein